MISDHIGFSGSRFGMSILQFDLVKSFLATEMSGSDDCWLHHGLCIGGDEEAHGIARDLNFKIHGHPPLDKKYTMDFDPLEFDAMDPPYSYRGRNQRILHACRLLIATPYSHQSGGGTWYTIQFARSLRKPHIVILRDGTIQQELYDGK